MCERVSVSECECVCEEIECESEFVRENIRESISKREPNIFNMCLYVNSNYLCSLNFFYVG